MNAPAKNFGREFAIAAHEQENDMNMVARQDEPIRPNSETAKVLSMIARAASDPAIDIDKLERLMQMRERMEARNAETDYMAAMADMQPELPSVGERGNAANRYTFALWEDINAAIKPILQKHGFSLTFRTSVGESVTVTGVLAHRAGHKEETTITLPADPSGNKNAVQALASSVSYGKRYTAGALLNLTSHGEDDDAFAAGGGYDSTDWMEKIRQAKNADDLESVRQEIKAATGIPKKAKDAIIAAWQARAKAVRS